MLIRGATWLAVAATALATVVFVTIAADGNYCWSAFAFTIVASGAAAGTLAVGVVPGWVRYRRTRDPGDRAALQLAWASFLVLVAEAVALQLMPQRVE